MLGPKPISLFTVDAPLRPEYFFFWHLPARLHAAGVGQVLHKAIAISYVAANVSH